MITSSTVTVACPLRPVQASSSAYLGWPDLPQRPRGGTCTRVSRTLIAWRIASRSPSMPWSAITRAASSRPVRGSGAWASTWRAAAMAASTSTPSIRLPHAPLNERSIPGWTSGRRRDPSPAVTRWTVARISVIRTTCRSVRSAPRVSGSNPSSRDHRPRYGSRGVCAWSPRRCSIAPSAEWLVLRSSSSCRASSARFWARRVSSGRSARRVEAPAVGDIRRTLSERNIPFGIVRISRAWTLRAVWTRDWLWALWVNSSTKLPKPVPCGLALGLDPNYWGKRPKPTTA